MKNIVLAFFFGVMGSISFHLLHNKFYGKTFAILDMKKVISAHMNEQGNLNLNDEQRLQRSSTFTNDLNHLLKNFSEKENLIFLVAPAVISDLPDYTEHIIHLMRRSDERP